MKVEFCLPVHNEEKILKINALKLLDYCNKQNFTFDWQIVIINNGSTDYSSKICRELAGGKIKIVEFTEAGKGRAVKIYAKTSQADILAYMDIDLSVSLDNINGLLDFIIEKDYDLVIGSRLLPESKVDRSFLRTLTSRIYNLLSRIILDHKLSDLQCGFKAIKGEYFRKIIPSIQDNHWFFDTELVMFANIAGYKTKEIPVEWHENRYEKRKSKVKLFRDSFRFLKNLFNLKSRLKKYN